MSYSMYLFCRSNQPILRAGLVESIKREKVFKSAQITPTEDQSAVHWKPIVLAFQPKRRPVVFSYYHAGATLAQITQDILEGLPGPNSPEKEQISRAIRLSKQLIVIELDPSDVPEDIWEALDCVEAHLAFTYEGLIFAPDEGFYDEGLDLIYPT